MDYGVSPRSLSLRFPHASRSFWKDGRNTLKDRVVLVTGGGGGIGRTIALLFAGEAPTSSSGDLNVAGGEETVEMIRRKGGQAVFVEANVTQFEDAEKMVAQVVENQGRSGCAHQQRRCHPAMPLLA